MIHVDEEEPSGELESQFNHRKVTFKRNKDVRVGFDMLCEIGRGKFGRVMKCSKKETGEVFAAKFVTCARREDRRNVEREVDIMNCLKSPRILQLYEAYDNGRNEMCLVTEYIGGGELFDRVIEDEFVLTERACRVFVKQILEGVNYIHRQGIIHLDLKPENILCLSKGGNRVKIIDFGLARKFEPMKKLQILFGTPEFVAPEPIGYSTDMWALGVISYVLVSGLSPFMGDTDLETMANVTIAEYDYEDEAFDNVSLEAKEFIDSLLVKDQASRATAEACLSHPWIQLVKVAEPAEEERVTLAKDNHSMQKTAWNNRDSNYYLFDYKSKTASQLYEMNLTLNPQQMMNVSTRCPEEEEEEEEDQFSFFTADGLVRRDSELTVNAEGKIMIRDGSDTSDTTANSQPTQDRKRSLEDVEIKVEVTNNDDNNNHSEDNIEYVGLVKRPKTPLITTKDIQKQVAQISERKQSGCGSLPDVISSSVETPATELHMSRCSLLEDNELLPLDNVITELSGVEEVPLPDIITPDENENGTDLIADDKSVPITPTITLAEEVEVEVEEERCNSVTKNYTMDKTYTVDDGFERPDGGWENVLSTVSVCGTEDYCDSSDISEDGSGDNKSSSSSSLPSESSGIFYKAEYTPPPPLEAQPSTNLLSIENRDAYWRNFFSRNSAVSSSDQGPRLEVVRSRSGCDGLTTHPANISQSKSDAKIGYNDPVTCSDLTAVRNASYPSDIENVPQEDEVNERSSLLSQDKKIEGQSEESLVIPRTLRSPLRNEIFDQPWTEVGGDSPEQVSSQDNLSSTISQEMQDLLTSIQSLGKSDEPVSKSKQSSPGKYKECSLDLPEKNVDFQSLMKEVENQIRFSVTAELLERMTNCPSIENYIISEMKDKDQDTVGGKTVVGVESTASPDTYLGSPPIPDLLKTSVQQPVIVDRLSQTHFYSDVQERKGSLPARNSPPAPVSRGVTSPSPDHRRRFTSLPRPSDMTGANNYPVTGRVPDMRARVNCSSDQDSYKNVCNDLSKVRSDIDSLCDIINNSGEQGPAENRESQRSSQASGRFDNDQLVLDLRETQHVMKDIEHTVDNFRRHLSLPNEKMDGYGQENRTSNIKSKRVPFPATNQSSVSKAKDRFERYPFSSASRGTPFSNTRSPSPTMESKKRAFSITDKCETCDGSLPLRPRTSTGTKMSLKKRSPSPVVTGKVSSFRSKFENVPSPAAQTIPRTYRLKSRDPQDIFGTSAPLETPGNLRGPKLSRDSSGLMSVSRNTSSSRLPNHFVSLHSNVDSCEASKPKINRAQSLRTPRYFTPSDSNATQTAANYLRSMLPKKMKEDYKSPFGYTR